MMRVAVVATLALGLLAAPLAAGEQAWSAPRIGVLRPGLPLDPYIEIFRLALRDLGYVEGRNVIVEFRWAHGREERLPELAADLARLPLDVIVVAGTKPTRAVQRATSTIPIVMAAVGNPVASRFVRSLTRPGGNITGVSLLQPGLGGKRIVLLKQLLPNAKTVAVLRNVDTLVDVEPLWRDTEAVARNLGVQLHVHDVRSTSELPQAFDTMIREGSDALLVLPDPTFTAIRGRIAELAAKERIPTMYEAREFTVAGGLISYAASLAHQFTRAAVYVDKILKGAKPADLPVEEPTKFELVINMKTAKVLGLTIPPVVLAQADEVIE
jgi:ABC-type uncharacterized transport system substrate-binding protein